MKKSFLKTKTVHGVKTGNHSNPNVLRAARASGGSCMVEGDSARPPMAKAPRMRRADGGEVKISEDSKTKAKELRDSASSDNRSAIMNGGIAAALVGTKGMGKVAKTINRGIVGVNAGLAGTGALSALGKKAEADRIEKGEAETGKEDRKHGGRVKKDCD